MTRFIFIRRLCLGLTAFALSSCQEVKNSDNGVKSLDELAGLSAVHDDCSGTNPARISSVPNRMLSENARSAPKPITDAIKKFFTAIPVPLQDYFLDRRGLILTVSDPKAFAQKNKNNILDPLDAKYQEDSFVLFFDFRGSKKANAAALMNVPAAQLNDYAFVIVLKEDVSSILKNGLRGFANFLTEAPAKLNEPLRFGDTEPLANAFLKDIMAYDKNKLTNLTGMIGERAAAELEQGNSQSLVQRLSFLMTGESAAKVTSELKSSRKERFKAAVLGHSIDSILCTPASKTSSNQVFRATLPLAESVLANFSKSLGTSLSLGGEHEVTFDPTDYRDPDSYSAFSQWKQSNLDWIYNYSVQNPAYMYIAGTWNPLGDSNMMDPYFNDENGLSRNFGDERPK